MDKHLSVLIVCLVTCTMLSTTVSAEAVTGSTDRNNACMIKLLELEKRLDDIEAKTSSGIADNRLKISEQDTRIAIQNEKMSDQNTKIAIQDVKISDQDKKLATQDTKISDQDIKIANQNTRIAEQDAKISEQNTKITEQDSNIAKQATKIAGQDLKISDQNTRISDQDIKIANQGIVTANFRLEISAKLAQLAGQDMTLANNCASVSSCDHQRQIRTQNFTNSSVQNFGVESQLSEMFQTRMDALQDIAENITTYSNKLSNIFERVSEIIEDKTKLQDKVKPSDCQDIKTANPTATSSVYRIYPTQSDEIEVFCDMDTDSGGWTVFQSRKDGSVNFQRTWNEYKSGFGNLQGEFWLGNEKIHRLVSMSSYMLRVDMEDFKGERRFANYSTFYVAGEDDKYRLTVGGYSGNAGDSLTGHNGTLFSTKDADNDVNQSHCSKVYKGGWWYHGGCHHSNPNGLYFYKVKSPHGQGINWNAWKKNYTHSLKSFSLKIKRN